MKIAVVGNFDKEISPDSKGGTEVFTYSLVNELVNHTSIETIDVYGVGKNHFINPKINFISILPNSARDFIINNEMLSQMSTIRSDFLTDFQSNIAVKCFLQLQNKKYDIIHNNSTSSIFNSMLSLLENITVTTLHTNASSPSIVIPHQLGLLTKNNKDYFVLIANHQKKFAEKNNLDLQIISTVYNGIDIKKFPFNQNSLENNYGLWIGRISNKHNKGIKEAIRASTNIHKPLKVLASIDDTDYFNKEIKDILDSDISLLPSNVQFDEKVKLYQNAKYFLYPIMWEEPFGLIFLESMATGTPVIAFGRGAVPEIIKDGETGFIVNPSDDDIRGDWIIKKTGIEGLCEAVEQIYAMPQEQYRQMRRKCREHVERNFTIEHMVDNYEKVYQQILEK